MTRNRATNSSIALYPVDQDADSTRRRDHESSVDEQASSVRPVVAIRRARELITGAHAAFDECQEGGKVYGVLSVLLQYYYHVEYLFSVGNESFTPQPKVQSGLIRLVRRENYLPVKSEKAFWLLVKTAFNQRRKTLRNGLKSIMAKKDLEDTFFDRRAETLSVEEFAALSFKMM